MNCVVPGCESRSQVQSHKFPKDAEVGEQRLKAICSPKLAKLSYEDIRKKQYRVCLKHFTENSWIQTFVRPRLKDNAVPTLCLSKSTLLTCVLPTEAPVTDCNDDSIRLNISQVRFSPSLKYVKSPGSTEVRMGSLATPPRKHVLKTEAAELCTTPRRLKSGAGADYQENVPTNVIKCSYDNLVYYEPKKLVKRKLTLHSTADLNEIRFIAPDPEPECSVQLKAAELNSAFPESVSQGEAASSLTSEKTRKILSSSLPPHKEVSVGEAASRSASAKVRKSLIEPVKTPSASELKKRIVYEGVRKRLRRRLLPKKRQVVDLTPKARKVFQEAVRLRKQLHKTKSKLQRYETQIAFMQTELDLSRNKINLLESKYILFDWSIENDMKV